jgi:hypothetical protein
MSVELPANDIITYSPIRLESCPYCGSKDLALHKSDYEAPTMWVVCNGCDACGPSNFLISAEDVWNHRAVWVPGYGVRDR